MFSFIRSGRARKAMAAALAATFVLSVAGCGQKQQQGGNKAALVKTMKVIKRDTPLVYDYTGFVQAQQEMERLISTLVNSIQGLACTYIVTALEILVCM